MQIAQMVPCTEAEGPGRRFAIWFQGCPLRCPGCCNPEMLSFRGGTCYSVEDLLQRILATRTIDGIEGITLLGGEPTAHAAEAAELAEAVQVHQLSVMVFSGYRLNDLLERQDGHILRLLAATDILVDGPYLRDQPEAGRRWIGSSNQQVHFLTTRYEQRDFRWQQPNTLELRLDDQGLTVNGFPSTNTRDFWHRPGGSARHPAN